MVPQKADETTLNKAITSLEDNMRVVRWYFKFKRTFIII